MISEEIIKDKFITDTLAAGTKKILTLQNQTARELLNYKTGRLFASLNDRSFSLKNGKEYHSVSVRILKYLRFNEIKQDMHLRGRLHLYNRIVWGVLYGETLPELKYGLTDELREQIKKDLLNAGLQLSFDFDI